MLITSARGPSGRSTSDICWDSGVRLTLWFAVQEQHESFISDTLDHAAVALLLPAMRRGEDIHVSGRLSEDLVFRVNGAVQRLLTDSMTGLSPITVSADELVPTGGPTRSDRGVGTGFSAGVDSYSVVADYLGAGLPSERRLTHLAFNDVGAHFTHDGSRRLHTSRLARTREAAARLDLPLIEVESNLDEFYDWDLNFHLTHQLRNISVAFLLQGGLRRYLYASASEFRNVSTTLSRPAEIDPMLLPLISTHDLNVESVGSEHSRSEKIVAIAKVPGVTEFLDVCHNTESGGWNCSSCWKCMNTMLSMEICGVLDDFGEVFDLGRYRELRDDWIAMIATHRSYRADELRRAASRHGFTPLLPSLGREVAYRVRNARRRGIAELASSGRDRTTASMYGTYVRLGRPGVAVVDALRSVRVSGMR